MIYAGTHGYLDGVEVSDVSDFETRLLDDVRSNGKKILETIASQQKLDDKVEKEMNKFLEKFTKGYVSAHKKAA